MWPEDMKFKDELKKDARKMYFSFNNKQTIFFIFFNLKKLFNVAILCHHKSEVSGAVKAR